MPPREPDAEPSPAPRLADGRPPLDAPALLARLARMGIAAPTVTHPAVFTVAEAKEKRGPVTGAHVKNLCLRNKRGRLWLLTFLEDRQLDLKALAEHLGAGRFSFASPRRLMAHLGVIPGAVTPLAAVNDREGVVEVVLDAELIGAEAVNVHPLDNTMTTALAPADLVRFLESVGHPPRVVDLEPFTRR